MVRLPRRPVSYSLNNMITDLLGITEWMNSAKKKYMAVRVRRRTYRVLWSLLREVFFYFCQPLLRFGRADHAPQFFEL
jgi:hypothetical protein